MVSIQESRKAQHKGLERQAAGGEVPKLTPDHRHPAPAHCPPTASSSGSSLSFFSRTKSFLLRPDPSFPGSYFFTQISLLSHPTWRDSRMAAGELQVECHPISQMKQASKDQEEELMVPLHHFQHKTADCMVPTLWHSGNIRTLETVQRSLVSRGWG